MMGKNRLIAITLKIRGIGGVAERSFKWTF